MPILSEEMFLIWKWVVISEKFPKSKFGHMCCELDSMSELSGFVYIKSHMTLRVKSKAQKVNSQPGLMKVHSTINSAIQVIIKLRNLSVHGNKYKCYCSVS